MSKKHEVGTGWAVVTGASSGLGAIFAEKLAERGLPLVLAGRDEARLAEVRQRVQQSAPGVDVELVVGDLGSQARRRGSGCGTGRPGGRRPDQQCGLRHLRPAAGGRPRPRARLDRRQRRCVGAPHARGAARNAGTRARPDSERRVDHRVSARPVSGHLRRLEGVRAVVQSGAVGRDARLGCKRDRVVPRTHPHRICRRVGCGRVAEPRSTGSSRHPNLLWPQDFGRSIVDDR